MQTKRPRVWLAANLDPAVALVSTVSRVRMLVYARCCRCCTSMVPTSRMHLVADGEREVPNPLHPQNGFHAAEQADVKEMEEGLRELEQDYH